MSLSTVPPQFEPDFASPAEWAAMYRSVGLQVVPARYPMRDRTDKRPALSTWTEFQHALTPDVVFERWYGVDGQYRKTPNMGLVTGAASGNVIVVDLDDHSKPEAALWWRGVTELHNHGGDIETWCQATGGGGRQLFFKAPADWHAPTNRTPIGVDIRGQGGFAMLPPSVHLSTKEYAWLDGCAPWEIEIAEAPRWLLEAIDDLVLQYGGDTRGLTQVAERTESPSTDFDPFGARVDGREDAMTRLVWGAIVAMHRATAGEVSEDVAREHFDQALARWLREAKTRLRGVPNAEGLERECRGETMFRAKWQRAMTKWHGKVAADAKVERTDIGPPISVDAQQLAGSAVAPIAFEDAFPIDGATLPRREWIIPGLLLRRHLSVLVAPPGSGKSLLTLQLAIAIALGHEWASWRIREPTKTLVVNAEDDADEMRRRLWAAAKVMRADQGAIGGKVFLASAPESIVVARVDARSKTVVRTDLVERLVKTILDNGIGAVVVDPFAETFEGDENSNSEVKWAGIAWREVARRTGAAVFLVHHTRKYAGDMAGNADASRGGGALIGTARIVSTLFLMTEEEAQAANVSPDERHMYVRFDDAKANMSLVTGAARWFRKHGVTLPNATISEPADEVGVLVPWKPPGLFANVSMMTIGLTLDTLDRGVMDAEGKPNGHFFTPSANGADKSRWAGTVVARLFGCDDEQAKKILKEWTKNGVLEEFEYADAKRNRKGVRSVPQNRPDRGQS